MKHPVKTLKSILPLLLVFCAVLSMCLASCSKENSLQSDFDQKELVEFDSEEEKAPSLQDIPKEFNPIFDNSVDAKSAYLDDKTEQFLMTEYLLGQKWEINKIMGEDLQTQKYYLGPFEYTDNTDGNYNYYEPMYIRFSIDGTFNSSVSLFCGNSNFTRSEGSYTVVNANEIRISTKKVVDHYEDLSFEERNVSTNLVAFNMERNEKGIILTKK